jgi:D-serine deaminase-like pyridoxal phosphate-dependent protein
MIKIDDLYETTLLLDVDKCKKNIRNLVLKAQNNSVLFRPHFKTHQSIEIGRWFREEGVQAITVSSLKMASFFAADGWNDITVAIPVNTREKVRINQLAQKIHLNLLFADTEGIKHLAQIAEFPINVWIKIDTGYHRTGVPHDDENMIQSIIHIAEEHKLLHFAGFLTHAGNSYHCKSNEEILHLHKETTNIMCRLKEKYSNSIREIKISVGDTPTCSVAEDFSMVDEIRPGNFVFYDTMQVQISACTPEDIAVAVACPVVAKHKDRNEIIIIGGGIHLSKDFILNSDGKKNYGDLVFLDSVGWGNPVQGCFLSKLSQEHGTLQVTDEVFEKIHTGDMVGVLPVHSCMTVNLLGKYTTLEGQNIDYFDLRKDYLNIT